MPDLESWIALSMVPEVGPITFKKLLSRYGDPASVFRAPLGELSATEGVGRKKAENIKNFSEWSEVDRQVKQLALCSARTITFLDADYPSILRQEDDAPVPLCKRIRSGRGQVCHRRRRLKEIIALRKTGDRKALL